MEEATLYRSGNNGAPGTVAVIDGFESMFEQYGAELLRYSMRLTRNSADADDLYQETFLKAFKAFDRLNGESNHRAWLYRIATNAANRWARRQRKSREITRHAASDHARHDSTTPLERREALDLLLRLHPRHQAVLLLHHAEGMPIDQIALALGIRPGTVKSRLARARAAYRDLLDASGEPR